MKPPLKVKSADDFQTPPEALDYLLPYLKKDWIIWECASGKGYLAQYLKQKGFKVFISDIVDYAYNVGDAGIPPEKYIDFLKDEPPQFDCIVTNPPYSLKQQFLERCYQLGKPFALLLPLTALETQKRQRLYAKYGIEIILLPKRINFETPSGRGSGSWFAVAWFTNGFNIGRQLVFPSFQSNLEEIREKEKKIEYYPMKFKCWNCGHIWEEKIQKGHLVRENNFGNKGAREEIDAFNAEWRDIICPNCGTKEEVRKLLEKVNIKNLVKSGLVLR
jgi:Zn finger protein HypA/HybF involved in hydrogenase expression